MWSVVFKSETQTLCTEEITRLEIGNVYNVGLENKRCRHYGEVQTKRLKNNSKRRMGKITLLATLLRRSSWNTVFFATRCSEKHEL